MHQNYLLYLSILTQKPTQSERVSHLQKLVQSSETHQKLVSGLTFTVLAVPPTGLNGLGFDAFWLELQTIVRDYFQACIYLLNSLLNSNFKLLR